MNNIVAAGSSQNVPVVSDNLDVIRSGPLARALARCKLRVG